MSFPFRRQISLDLTQRGFSGSEIFKIEALKVCTDENKNLVETLGNISRVLPKECGFSILDSGCVFRVVFLFLYSCHFEVLSCYKKNKFLGLSSLSTVLQFCVSNVTFIRSRHVFVTSLILSIHESWLTCL